MAEVTGAAFLGFIKHVRDSKSPDFLNLVIQDSGAVTGAVLTQRVITVGWYPYQAYTDFIKSLDRNMGRGDLEFCRQLGEIAAKRDLETIYDMYMEERNPERLIRDCGLIWKSYYRDAGRMETIAWEPDDTVLRIIDFPEMDRAHCRLMEGWMTEAIRGMGVKIVNEMREHVCMSRGAPYHEFKITWTKENMHSRN